MIGVVSYCAAGWLLIQVDSQLNKRNADVRVSVASLSCLSGIFLGSTTTFSFFDLDMLQMYISIKKGQSYPKMSLIVYWCNHYLPKRNSMKLPVSQKRKNAKVS